MPDTWDPTSYLTYSDERGRPFVDLIAAVHAERPERVVDLGCGPGNLTRLLADRWPNARIAGVDSSAEMVKRAVDDDVNHRIAWSVADIRDWVQTAEQVDVLVTNATLQWIPDHLDLLAPLTDHVRPGGWFAMQVPGNFDQPSHTIRRELAAREPYASVVDGSAVPDSDDPIDYLRALRGPHRSIDVWETTYLHVLRGPDPVFTWVSATGARPTLQALRTADPALEESFSHEFRARLNEAYPAEADGTVLLPFRRIFAVVHLT